MKAHCVVQFRITYLIETRRKITWIEFYNSILNFFFSVSDAKAMPGFYSPAISKFKICSEKWPDEIICVFEKYFLIVNRIIIYFPVFAQGKPKFCSPFHPFIKIKAIVIHWDLPCVSAHEPNIQLVIITRDIIVNNFYSIIHPIHTGFINHYEIRYREYVPPFFYIDQDIYKVTIETFQCNYYFMK